MTPLSRRSFWLCCLRYSYCLAVARRGAATGHRAPPPAPTEQVHRPHATTASRARPRGGGREVSGLSDSVRRRVPRHTHTDSLTHTRMHTRTRLPHVEKHTEHGTHSSQASRARRGLHRYRNSYASFFAAAFDTTRLLPT